MIQSASRGSRATRARRVMAGPALALLTACTIAPVQPVPDANRPLASLPESLSDIEDDRAGFRHAFCEVNRQAGSALPNYRACEDALTRYPDEPVVGAGGILERTETLWIASIVLVPGSGWACARADVQEAALLQHLSEQGYRVSVAPIEGLASSARNARLLHDHLGDESSVPGYSPIVLIGYAKGVPDILEMLVRYPELSERVIAVISIAGAVGGSPLADGIFRRSVTLPGQFTGDGSSSGRCVDPPGDALDSLKTSVRREWLQTNPLPAHIRYYSLASLPAEDNISTALLPDQRRLNRIDTRNDGRLLYPDQILPRSKFLAFLNADHFAATMPDPTDRSRAASAGLTATDYPREVLLESLLRYLELDFSSRHQAAR